MRAETRNLDLVRLFLLLMGSEAILASVMTFASPSMQRNVVLFGLSSARLAAGGMAFALGSSSIIYAALSVRIPSLIMRPLRFIQQRAPSGAALWGISVLASATLFSTLALLLITHPITGQGSYTLHIGVIRFLPVSIWLALLPLHALVLLILWSRSDRPASQVRLTALLRLVPFSLSLTLSGLHFLVLTFQIPLLSQMEGWYWQFIPKRFYWSHLTLVVVLILMIACFNWLRKHNNRKVKTVVLLVSLAFLAHYFPGFIHKQGLETVKSNYRDTELSDELRLICTAPPDIEDIRNYEAQYGEIFWYSTKPPGLLIVYSLLRQTIHWVAPAHTAQSCFSRLLDVQTFLFPLIVAFSTLLLIDLSTRLNGRRSAVIVPLLYVTAPSYSLMAMVPDQAIYPPLYIAALWLLGRSLMGGHTWLAPLAGAMAFLATFVSFSLLPLILLVFLWTVLHNLTRSETDRLKTTLSQLLLTGIGFAIPGIVAWVLFSYNPAVRLQNALASHREIKEMSLGLSKIWEYGTLNAVDFSIWIGLPLAVLAAAAILRAGQNTLSGDRGASSAFQTSLGLTILAILLSGQARGEVGRIWHYLVPTLAIPAADELERLKPFTDLNGSIILVLQVLTTYFTFIFQDFF